MSKVRTRSSCKRSYQEAKEVVKHLTAAAVTLDSRIATVNAMMPQGFIKGFPESSSKSLNKAIAGIPDKYLQWLIELYKERKFQGIIAAPGMSGGVTEFGNVPIYIRNGTSARIIEGSLQHEIGHAIYPLLAYQSSAGEEFIRKVSEDAWAQRTNQALHPYPKSYLRQNKRQIYTFEYWAEAFNSYYCSPDTEHLVRQHFPSTYNLLETYLEPPVWRSSQDLPPQSIAVLIDDTSPQGWTFYVAGKVTDASAVICSGKQRSCEGSDNERWQLALATEKQNRKIFKTQTLLPRSHENVFTIEMRSANDEISIRTFRLEKNASL